MKRRKTILLALAALVAASVIITILEKRNAATMDTPSSYITQTVEYGSVVRSITGNGVLDSVDVCEVEAEESVEIEGIPVKVGDYVTAGDVLAVYDTESVRDRIDEIYSEIESLDADISTRDTESYITSPTYGRVKELYVSLGDDLDDVMHKHGALMLLSTDDKMQITIQTDQDIDIGRQVTVMYGGTQQTGTVADWIPGGYLITMSDYSALPGIEAKVYLGNTELGEGIIEIHAPLYVYGTGGHVSSVYVSVNSLVYEGSNLIRLADNPVTDSYRDAMADRDDLAEELSDLYSLLDNPVLLAPESGVIGEILAEEGQSVDGDAFVIHIGGARKMTVDVDELDIIQVSVGQSASVTLDAFSGEQFQATVSRVSQLGEASGSITTYDVELLLSPDDRLREGMNGSAVISAERRDHVLVIPVAAIYEDEAGSYVLVLNGNDLIRRDITTGLSDGTTVEVTSGLSEGEIIRFELIDRSGDIFAQMMQHQGPQLSGGE